MAIRFARPVRGRRRMAGAAIGMATVALLVASGSALAVEQSGPTPKGYLPRYAAGGAYTWAFDSSSGWNANPAAKSAALAEMTRLATIADKNAGGPFYAAGFYANLPRFSQIADQQLATSTANVTLVWSYNVMTAVTACGDATTAACRYGGSSGAADPRNRHDQIDFNSNLKWCVLGAASPCYDVANVTAHEMGHVFNMQHYPGTNYGPGGQWTIMEPWTRPNTMADAKQTWYGSCDVARLQLSYGVVSYTNRYSPCLNNVNVSLTLSSNASTSYSKDYVVFTARLAVAGSQSSAENAKFANNPLSGRSVALQVSYDNGATWSSYTTLMESSSGVYTRTFNVTSTRLFRAVFADPGASEALYGATSAVWKQTVIACTGGGCPL